MGEIAEMMIDGEMCSQCGTYLGDACGFPRSCGSCEPLDGDETGSDTAPTPRDPYVKQRRWLQAAAQSEGVAPAEAPAYLAKLAKRGFAYRDTLTPDPTSRDAYFITNKGRAELARIGELP